MKKIITLVLTAALLLTLAISASAAEKTPTIKEKTVASITVTRAEASDSFEHGYEAEYDVKFDAEGELDGDAWIGIYSTDLVGKVMAGEEVFSGHSFGSWCRVTLEGAHGTALAANTYHVNHTDGEWGQYVINEGESNPAIWGGALNKDTEYQAVLFQCDEDGYTIVALSDAFTFAEAAAPETNPEPTPDDPAPKTADALAAVVISLIAAAAGIVLVKKH